MEKIVIEDLYSHLANILSHNFTGMMVECCSLCLNSQSHNSPIVLLSNKEKQNLMNSDLSLEWAVEITSKIIATYNDENRVTDHAAMCLALHLAFKLTDFDCVETSQKGDGVDFWFSKNDSLEFVARLEVSGIRKENGTNTLKNRLKIKLNQTKQSDNTDVPAYVSIIEFSKPEAIYISK